VVVKRIWVPSLLLLSAVNGGCFLTSSATGGWDLFTNSFRNSIHDTIRCVDDAVLTLRNYHQAEEAWDLLGTCSPGRRYSADFEEGFKAGFIDYLDAGGNGQPPAVPPLRYQLCADDAAQHAAQDWFTGFRLGASVARASGLREASLVPLADPSIALEPASLPPAHSPIRPLEAPLGMPRADALPSGEPPPTPVPAKQPEELPLPRRDGEPRE
jgi:hypothetical protein